jgi:hypothetical protein
MRSASAATALSFISPFSSITLALEDTFWAIHFCAAVAAFCIACRRSILHLAVLFYVLCAQLGWSARTACLLHRFLRLHLTPVFHHRLCSILQYCLLWCVLRSLLLGSLLLLHWYLRLQLLLVCSRCLWFILLRLWCVC